MSEITSVSIDLAKRVFQLHGSDAHGGIVLQRQVRRAQLLSVLAQLPRCEVTMEACGGAHHWARQIRLLGHEVRLIAAQHVKAFCRRQKNDRNDAEAIACAARQPGMPQVAVKSEEQQAVLALHRMRERLMRERIALTNQLHGLLGEFGFVLPPGLKGLRQQLRSILDAASLPPLLQGALPDQLEHLGQIEQRLGVLSRQLEHLARASEPCQRLMRHRGVGPLTATAFLAELADARLFRNGRQVSAWLGLVPRQHSSGGRLQLHGITKRGDPYLRKLLVHGARSALRHACGQTDPISRWAVSVQQRRGTHRACVALANKTARRLWATLRYEQPA
jgi:transposase